MNPPGWQTSTAACGEDRPVDRRAGTRHEHAATALGAPRCPVTDHGSMTLEE